MILSNRTYSEDSYYLDGGERVERRITRAIWSEENIPLFRIELLVLPWPKNDYVNCYGNDILIIGFWIPKEG